MTDCSIVIPTRDRPVYLRVSLEFVRTSKGPGDEVIVVDNSLTMAEHVKLACDLSGAVDRYIFMKTDNATEALNAGIAEAKGQFIRPWADDDFLLAGHAQAVEVMKAHPEIDVLVTGGVKFSTDGTSAAIQCFGEGPYARLDGLFNYGAFGGAQLIRKTVFDTTGPYTDNPIADIEFVARCIFHGLAVRYCRLNTYLHPVYPHSFLKMKEDRQNAAFKALIRQYNCSDQPMPKNKLYPPVWDGAIL